MKKNWTWIALVVLMVALIGGATVLYNQLGDDYSVDQLATQKPPVAAETENAAETSQTEPEKMIAPDFAAVDGEGNEVKLSDFFGKPIVLNFWASWCGPCKSEMPDFNETYLAMGEEIQFLMVNMTDGGQETLESAKSFVESSGFDFPVYYDVHYEAAIAYGVTSLPTTYFIAADGTMTAYARGAIDAETLQRGIAMIAP